MSFLNFLSGTVYYRYYEYGNIQEWLDLEEKIFNSEIFKVKEAHENPPAFYLRIWLSDLASLPSLDEIIRQVDEVIKCLCRNLCII